MIKFAFFLLKFKDTSRRQKKEERKMIYVSHSLAVKNHRKENLFSSIEIMGKGKRQVEDYCNSKKSCQAFWILI